VLAVAQDAGGAETTRPWIRPTSMEDQYPQPILDLMGWDADAWRGAGPPQYPCLIDERHEVSRLYGMVNVPTAVWIDEEGRIVRPPEPAGVNEAFKAVDLATFSMPPEAIEAGSSNRNRYLAAVRDWVRPRPPPGCSCRTWKGSAVLFCRSRPEAWICTTSSSIVCPGMRGSPSATGAPDRCKPPWGVKPSTS